MVRVGPKVMMQLPTVLVFNVLGIVHSSGLQVQWLMLFSVGLRTVRLTSSRSGNIGVGMPTKITDGWPGLPTNLVAVVV